MICGLAIAGAAPAALEILAKAGGKPVRKLKVVENLTRDVTAGAALMMEFPSAEAVKSALDRDAYKALLPDRKAAYMALSILLFQDIRRRHPRRVGVR